MSCRLKKYSPTIFVMVVVFSVISAIVFPSFSISLVKIAFISGAVLGVLFLLTIAFILISEWSVDYELEKLPKPVKKLRDSMQENLDENFFF